MFLTTHLLFNHSMPYRALPIQQLVAHPPITSDSALLACSGPAIQYTKSHLRTSGTGYVRKPVKTSQLTHSHIQIYINFSPHHLMHFQLPRALSPPIPSSRIESVFPLSVSGHKTTLRIRPSYQPEQTMIDPSLLPVVVIKHLSCNMFEGIGGSTPSSLHR